MKRYLWTPWAGYTIAILVAFVSFAIPRKVSQETDRHESVVARTVMKAQVSAQEGSTTTITPDGVTTITGPAKITLDAASTTSKTLDSTTKTVYASPARWSAGAVAVLPSLSPRPAYGATVGYRLLGPVWVEGMVLLRESVPDAGVAIRVTF